MLALAQKHATQEEDEVPSDEWDLESEFVSTCNCIHVSSMYM